MFCAGSATAETDAKQLYQRCAACHLPDGAGIPGSFPPLKNRIRQMAASELGRTYLVDVINVGLIGPISVGGESYMGVMPAQGSSYDAAKMSDLLNYMAQELDEAITCRGHTSAFYFVKYPCLHPAPGRRVLNYREYYRSRFLSGVFLPAT